MHWQNFKKFAVLHLPLGPCLTWHIGPPCFRAGGTHPVFTFRTWVERQVEYLAVRPFSTLPMEAKSTADETTSTTYTVCYRRNAEELPFTRMGSTTTHDGRQMTIAEAFESYVETHRMDSPAGTTSNPDLIIDAVVRHIKRRTPGDEYYRESIEIFFVPDEAQPARGRR